MDVFFGGGTHGIRYAPAVSDVVVDAGPARVQSYDSVAVLSVDVLSVCVLSVCVLSVGVLSVAVLSVGVVRPGRSTADHQPHRHGQLAAFAPENDASRRPRGPRRVAAQTTRQGPCVVFHIYVRVSLCPRAYLRNCAPIFTAKFLCLAALRTPGFRDDTVLANNGQKLNGRRKKAYTQSNSTGGNDVAACGRLGVAACLACVVAAAVDRQADRTRTGLFCRVSPGGVNWLWSGPVWPVYWNLAISEELQSLTWTGLSVEESTRMTEDWDKWRK